MSVERVVPIGTEVGCGPLHAAPGAIVGEALRGEKPGQRRSLRRREAGPIYSLVAAGMVGGADADARGRQVYPAPAVGESGEGAFAVGSTDCH